MDKEKRFTKELQCEHCGNNAPMEIKTLYMEAVFDDKYSGFDNEVRHVGDFAYELLRCPACKQATLRSYFDLGGGPHEVIRKVLYPVQPKSPKGLPPQLLHEYKEAMRARSINANLYGMSIGRVLEFIYLDRGAAGKTLAKKLEDLANKGEIPSNLVKVAHNLRLFRNIGTHETSFELTDDDLPILDDLLQAILMYVYTAPFIAKQAEERYERLRGKSSKDGSDSKAPETS